MAEVRTVVGAGIRSLAHTVMYAAPGQLTRCAQSQNPAAMWRWEMIHLRFFDEEDRQAIDGVRDAFNGTYGGVRKFWSLDERVSDWVTRVLGSGVRVVVRIVCCSYYASRSRRVPVRSLVA
jgi:hypothetical protein